MEPILVMFLIVAALVIVVLFCAAKGKADLISELQAKLGEANVERDAYRKQAEKLQQEGGQVRERNAFLENQSAIKKVVFAYDSYASVITELMNEVLPPMADVETMMATLSQQDRQRLDTPLAIEQQRGITGLTAQEF